MYNTLNALNDTELFVLKWLILCEFQLKLFFKGEIKTFPDKQVEVCFW